MSSIDSDYREGSWVDIRVLLDHVVYEVYGILLIMTFVDPQGSNSGSIFDGCILKSMNLLALSILDSRKRHVNLDVMARYLLGITTRINCAAADVLG